MYICVCLCVRICICVYLYIYVYVCIYHVYICVCVYSCSICTPHAVCNRIFIIMSTYVYNHSYKRINKLWSCFEFYIFSYKIGTVHQIFLRSKVSRLRSIKNSLKFVKALSVWMTPTTFISHPRNGKVYWISFIQWESRIQTCKYILDQSEGMDGSDEQVGVAYCKNCITVCLS